MQVAQQCKENIFAIQTLKDFQFVEENKDQGLNVREKAKAMVSLLKVTFFDAITCNCTAGQVLLQDDERLKNERVRALKAKERFAQSTAGELHFYPFMLNHIFLEQNHCLFSCASLPMMRKGKIEICSFFFKLCTMQCAFL